ncbi:MAG: O-methyltransferase [Chitinophagaceae bacterium]|nr:O-methyltransferase [Chitinophagaceae bacterium]
MAIIRQKATEYAERFTTAEDGLLHEIAEYTIRNHPEAQMLSGHVQGKLLEMVSCMIRPQRVLEIGTFMGYSAICLAKGLTDRGELHTLELREKDAETAKGFIRRSSYNQQIKVHIGDAGAIMETLKETWDLVFIDADKVNYVNYYEAVFPNVRQGGFILADNVLFHGEVLEQPIKGKNAIAIDAFNWHVLQDNRVEQVMLTVRDGLLLIRKK